MTTEQTPKAAYVTNDLRLRLLLSELTYYLNPPKPILRRQTCHPYALDPRPSSIQAMFFQPAEGDFLAVNPIALEKQGEDREVDGFVLVS